MVMSIDILCPVKIWPQIALWLPCKTEMKSKRRKKVRMENQRSPRLKRVENKLLTEKIRSRNRLMGRVTQLIKMLSKNA